MQFAETLLIFFLYMTSLTQQVSSVDFYADMPSKCNLVDE